MAGKGLPGPLRLPIVIIALSFLIISSITNTASVILSAAAAPTEAEALIEFKSTLSASGGEEALQSWSVGGNPCSQNHSAWRGVLCTNGKVWGLQLERMSLSGHLNITPLVNLPSLRALSFMDNNFVGPMPDLSQLGALKSLYLANNQFSGVLPDDAFAGTRSLKKIYIHNNEFTGKIPSSLSILTKLLFLRLDDNEFEGELPDLNRAVNLQLVNVSYNKLSGRIPDSISNMDGSLFAGNENLCGPPLADCPSPEKGKKSSRGALIGTLVGCILLVLIILLLLCLLCRQEKKDSGAVGPASETEGGTTEAKREISVDAAKLEQAASAASAGGGGGHSRGHGKKSSKDPEHGRLAFVKEDKERFEMQDLLRASAEVLGSGNFGSSYKAVLINGPSVVVKRFKDMTRVGREDFQEHMRRLGGLSHPNVLPLVAYYYRKEEKLLITRYIINGSLAHMLHGSRGSNLPPLDWPARLKIIKGVARGLAYLYEELPMLTLPHGHLKSSNVLIDDNFEPVLMDYALVPVVNTSHASQVMVAYKSPEIAETGKPSKKSDVYSLGILILETLTGKFPATYLQKGKGGTDLASWVNSVAKEEEVVFDSEMKGTKNAQGEMSKLLQIGLMCCEIKADRRWDIKKALEKIEELKVREGDSPASPTGLAEVELSTEK